MERRVFLEMSPVASERFLTEEEFAECRRRAARPSSWFLVRLGWGLVILTAVFSFACVDNLWVKGVAYTLGSLLAIAGVFGAYMLWRAFQETRLLAQVDETTVVYRFLTNGYWRTYNLPTFFSPPPEIEVMYPQSLAIRSGGSLWRVFRPVPLVIIEDLPQRTPGTTSREFTELERIELEKHLSYYKKSLAFGLLVLPLGVFASIWEFGSYDGGWPTLSMLVLPVGILFMAATIWSDRKRIIWFRKAREAGALTIEWAKEASTEWLAVGDLEWREGGDPARWRTRRP